jgi:predicted  nucleic acid-binding Zn-ribbon protein
MEKAFKNVKRTLHRLQDLHKIHMKSFDQDVLPDLERQSQDRDIEMGLLMKSVSTLMELTKNETGENTKSMLHALTEKMTPLLEQNKVLETRVSAFRDQLKKNMKQVSKGRNAISSYRSSTAASTNPRVISITNY